MVKNTLKLKSFYFVVKLSSINLPLILQWKAWDLVIPMQRSDKRTRVSGRWHWQDSLSVVVKRVLAANLLHSSPFAVINLYSSSLARSLSEPARGFNGLPAPCVTNKEWHGIGNCPQPHCTYTTPTFCCIYRVTRTFNCRNVLQCSFPLLPT